MKKTWVFILMTMILFFFASCVNQNSLNPSISLGRLGNEGELFIKGNAYHIIDYPFLGISVVALNRETLPESFSGVQDLSLRSEQMEIAFSTNPYNKAILELTLPDSFPKEQILLMSILPSSKDMTESVADERDDLYLEYVTIQKAVEVNGSNLYQIETMNFISMRNAGVFVFDLLGNFIIPSYVTSNEAYTYAVNTFLSVRNASPDTSISGALTFIKELPAHEDYLEDINPNTVVVEGNDIIVVPPEQDERKLRDLGPEGPLNLPDNVYQILDNTSLFGLWSVSFKSSRLPEPEAAGSSWQLVLNETEFLFYQNIHDPDIYEINLDESLVDDIEQIRDAHFQVADEASCTLTVQSNPQAGGEVRVNEGGWGDVQTVVSIIGQAAILEARENVGYNFDGWYENQQLLSVNNPYTLTANSDRQIEARFSLIPNTPPTVTKVSGPEGTIRETTSSFSWTGSDSGISGRSISHYRYQKDGGTWTTISGTSYTWSHGRGNHTFGVVAVDDEGAESSIVVWTFNSVENVLPTVTKVSGPEGTIRETTSSFSWTASDSGISGRSISHYRYQKDGGTWTTISGTSYTWSHGRGNHTFGVVAVDDEGAESSIVEWVFNSVENVPPTLTKVSGVSGTTSQTSATFSWSGSDSDGTIDHYAYRKDSGSWQTTSSTSYTWSGYTEGAHTFSVKAFDNEGAESAIISWTFTYAQSTGEIVYRALLIGIENYDGNNDLTYTYDDVLDIETVMNNQDYDYQIEKMGGSQQVTKTQLLAKLDEYVNDPSIDANDVFFFGYSGHGGYSSGTSNLLSSDLRYVSVSEIREKLDNIPGTKIVSIDACESGAFVNISDMRLEEPMDAQMRMYSFVQGIIDTFASENPSRAAFVTEYEYYAMAAAAINEYSYENDEIQNGFYSFFLADGVGHTGLSNPTGPFNATYNADANSNDAITLAELFNYVRTQVDDYSEGDQTVQVYPASSSYLLFEYTAGANTAPTLTKVSGNEGTYANSSNTFSWSGSDSDGTIDHYAYRKDSGSWQTTSSTSYTWSGYAEGAHTFSVKAFDNEGAESPIITWTFDYSSSSSEGMFKVANSWGVDYWENVPDGFYYITYESFLQNVDYVYVAEKGYTPTRAIAVFDMDHPIRTDCDISIGVGNPASPEKEINFSGHSESFYFLSGTYPYPDNVMVMDITPLLPISNKTVFLKVHDKTNTANTGTLQSFKIEVYSTYDTNKTTEYIANDVPLNTVNGYIVASQITNVSIAATSERDGVSELMSSSKTLSNDQMERIKNIIGVADEEKDYNEIVQGYGTGYRPPTEREWEMMAEKSLLREITSYHSQARPVQVDHSASAYFPPIGNQGSKGSCSSWSTVYYAGTFYNATRYGRDLSGAQWLNGYYGYPSAAYDQYIMSPDFAYLQLNRGGNNGTSIFDNVHLMHLIGNASWESWPYDLNNFTQWPGEQAWREAPKYRLNWKSDWPFDYLDYYPFFYLEMTSTQDIETLKNLLAAGYLVSFSVDANQYDSLTSEDIWHTGNYDSSGGTNHANTLVGYID